MTHEVKSTHYKTEAEALAAPGKIVRHYKGGIYRVLFEDAKHSETLEVGVVYEHLFPHEPGIWFRPKDLFWGTLEPEKGGGARFTLIKEE